MEKHMVPQNILTSITWADAMRMAIRDDNKIVCILLINGGGMTKMIYTF